MMLTVTSLIFCIVSILVSAIVGGVIYDLVKSGFFHKWNPLPTWKKRAYFEAVFGMVSMVGLMTLVPFVFVELNFLGLHGLVGALYNAGLATFIIFPLSLYLFIPGMVWFNFSHRLIK
jgi:hypothetical protein